MNVLTPELKRRAGVAFRQFASNSDTPGLQFKKVGEPDLYSVRVTEAVRVLGYREGDTVTWFWIGYHDDYVRIIRRNQ